MAEVRRERIAEYRALHEAIWPDYAALVRAAGLGDFTIHLDEARALLFMRFTYTGDDLDGDLARLDAHPRAQAWAAAVAPCFEAPPGADPWTPLTPVFEL